MSEEASEAKRIGVVIMFTADERTFNKETKQFARSSEAPDVPFRPSQPIDPTTHPLVIMCAEHWNDFQRVMDETGTREKFREKYAVLVPARTERVRVLGDSERVVFEREVDPDEFGLASDEPEGT